MFGLGSAARAPARVSVRQAFYLLLRKAFDAQKVNNFERDVIHSG
jgi:hypothetical protein